MAILPFRFSEESRCRLARVLCKLCLLQVMLGACVVAMGGYYKWKVSTRIGSMDTESTDYIYLLLISFGSVSGIAHLIAARMFQDCSKIRTRYRTENILMCWLCLLFVVLWVLLAGTLMFMNYKELLGVAFMEDLIRIMHLYGKSRQIKDLIDQIHIEEKCCGSISYKDWWRIPWTNKKYVSPRSKKGWYFTSKGEPITDAAPWTCCSPYVLQMCIHENMRPYVKIVYVGRGKYKVMHSLYESGCATILSSQFHGVLDSSWKVMLLGHITEWVILILARYLQTAMDNAHVWGDPLGPAPGWLMEQCPCGCLGDANQPGLVPVEDTKEARKQRKKWMKG